MGAQAVGSPSKGPGSHRTLYAGKPQRIKPTPGTSNYPAYIERDCDGRYVVTFPDFGWGTADGATRREALAEAEDLLRELIAATMREAMDLPEASRTSKRRPLIVAPLPIALQADLYDA